MRLLFAQGVLPCLWRSWCWCVISGGNGGRVVGEIFFLGIEKKFLRHAPVCPLLLTITDQFLLMGDGVSKQRDKIDNKGGLFRSRQPAFFFLEKGFPFCPEIHLAV